MKKKMYFCIGFRGGHRVTAKAITRIGASVTPPTTAMRVVAANQ